MHKIFLCHASEDKAVAERIQLGLASAGHIVFYDEHSLPPGGDYHQRIRQAILECDLFIFLVSSNSIAPGKFTLTELMFARERWPSPVDHVLPVNLENIPAKALPAYLSAVTILCVAGNAASEVRAAVEKMLSGVETKKTWRRTATIAGAGACVALIVSIGIWRMAAGPAITLPAPTPIQPVCGTVVPAPSNGRYIGFNWSTVEGASTYTVEVDCFGCSGRQWFSATGQPWHVRPGLGLRTPLYSSDLYAQLRQERGTAIRWRVWAIDQGGAAGMKSPWCQVAFAGG